MVHSVSINEALEFCNMPLVHEYTWILSYMEIYFIQFFLQYDAQMTE